MPTLLFPAALWALAALALPLALHLWRPPPRTVRLPSLRFLQSTARPLRNLRWRELPLLGARLLLLTLLALLLARLVWQPPAPTRPARWILLDPAAQPVGASLDRLHALQRSGYQTRLLAPGTPRAAASPTNPTVAPSDVWSVLREADAALPPRSSIAVFSPGYLASLRGLRPALGNVRVEWVQTPPPPAPANPQPATRNPQPASILLLHDAEHAEDARYLTAALDAVAKTAARPLDIQTSLNSHPASRIPPPNPQPATRNPPLDWTFWLASDPPPPSLAAHTTNLFTVAAGPSADSAPGVILPAPGTPGTDAFSVPVHLWQRTAPAPGATVWTDGFGVPLLTLTRLDGLTRWHLASRFHPAWSDLPRTTAFPAWLRALLASGEATPPPDERLADPTQCQPSDAPAAPAPAELPLARDLSGPLLLLAAALFAVERLLSHRRPARAAVAAPPLPTAAAR